MIPFPAAVFAEAKRYVSQHAYHTPLLTLGSGQWARHAG